MSVLLVLSIVLRLAALAWSLVLLRRLRDVRVAFLAALLVLMTLRQLLTLVATSQVIFPLRWGPLDELPGLMVSVLSVLAIVYIGNLIEDIRTTENRFAELFQASVDPMMVYDLEGHIVDANPAALKELGYSRAELLRKTVVDLHPPEELLRAEALLEQVNAKGSVRFEMPLVRRNGKTFAAEVSAATVSFGGRQFIQGIIRNISRRRVAEHEREHSLSLLRATLESTADGILVVDRGDAIVSYNQRFLELWRVPEEMIENQSDNEAIQFATDQLKDPDSFLSKVEDLYERPEAKSFDLLEFKDGRVFERYSMPQRLGDEIVGRVWSFRDVTTRMRAESALRRSEERYRDLVRGAAYGIYRSTVQGRFVWVNPALVAMLGYDSEEELMQVNLQDLYADARQRDDIVRRYTGQDYAEGEEIIWIRKDAQEVTLRLSGRVINNDAGEIEEFEVIAENITERKLLEAQLRQAQKMEAVGQLTGGIAHDFNNILTAISSSAALIADSTDENDQDLRPILDILQNAVSRGSDMTRKLLAFSRKETLSRHAVDPKELVHGAAGMLSRVLPESIRLNVVSEGKVPPIEADPASVEQILLNLATNARDAMPDGGVLGLEIRRTLVDEDFCTRNPWCAPGEYVEVAVSDTGEGMGEEVKSKIFEPFFTTKPPGLGTGLGMAMIYGLMKQHEGYVTVFSAPGEGTTVRLLFPVAKSPVDDVQQPRLPTVITGGSETLLVVEDEADVRDATRLVLSRYGYTVLCASDGQEALRLFEDRRAEIDLIVSDVVMPHMSGPELYETVRSTDSDVKFVFTSGYTARDVRSRATLAPDLPFVRKPYSVPDLLLTVRAVLDGTHS